LLGLA
ncbi:hypothetical protein D030_0767B, partial [Vibrio parahaemolyticus AQ3810]